jgi:hypothetical protein
MIIRLIIKERKGFTTLLANRGDLEMLALIDGPYSREIQLRSYSTILLFASEIGIARVLLYAQQILKDYDAQKTCYRKILLF